MAITEPCYATRDEVKQALDIKLTTRSDAQVDRAIQAASRSVDSLLHRVFYPKTMTRYWDWPNYQYAYPFRVWFDAWELADATTAVVKSGGQTISAVNCLFEPVNSGPPYTYLELDRSSVAAFGVNKTPQRDISITGIFGHTISTASAGVLALALTDTTGTAVQVSNGVALGVGDNILIDSERMLVTERTMLTTAQTQQGSGVSTAVASDVALAVTDGTKYFTGEILLLDSERMLIVDIAGNTLTVKRAWDGSALATHTGATVYALRLLTVTRGALGTTAATHLVNAPIGRGLMPALVKELAVAEALNDILQESSGYSRTMGEGMSAQHGIGNALDAIRGHALSRHGRKARVRVI